MMERARTKSDGTVLTDERLTEVFDLVKPSPNWKYPIDARVPKAAADLEEIELAVIWFAGGSPVVLEDGDNYHVLGAGYYEWIGA